MDVKPAMEPRPFIKTKLPELVRQIEAKKMDSAAQAAKVARAHALYGMLSSPNRLGLDKTQQETIMIGANRAGAEAAKKVETELKESPIERVDKALHETASQIAAEGDPKQEQWITRLRDGSRYLRTWAKGVQEQINIELVNLSVANANATPLDAYKSLVAQARLNHQCLIMEGVPSEVLDKVMLKLVVLPARVSGINVLKQTALWQKSIGDSGTSPGHLKNKLDSRVPDVKLDVWEDSRDPNKFHSWIYGDEASMVKIADTPPVDSLFVREPIDMSKFAATAAAPKVPAPVVA